MLSKTLKKESNAIIKPEKIKTGEIKMFTDGSCIKTKNGTFCGYGIYFPNQEIKNVSRPFLHKPLTNQRSELYAIYKGIKKISRHYSFDKLIIYSDSEYSIKSMTIWINNWKKNGWKTANKKPVLNVDIIKKIDKYMQKYEGKILFQHVTAHTGKQDELSKGNDIVDGLAKKGAMKLMNE